MRALLVASALAASACKTPEPPVLTPKAITVQSLDQAGLRVVASVEAFNPNSSELSAQGFRGHLKVAGTIDLGEVVVATPVKLPPSSRTMFEVPVSASWQNLAALGVAAAQNEEVPYVLEGKVSIGGSRLQVDVPLTMTGTLPRAQLVQITLQALPKLNFGLPQ